MASTSGYCQYTLGYCNYKNPDITALAVYEMVWQIILPVGFLCFFQNKALLKAGALVWLILHLTKLQVLIAVAKMLRFDV